MVLGYELFNEVFVFHLPLNPHLLFYLKSSFLEVCTSFHHVWQWQNEESNQSPCTWTWLRGGGGQVFSRLDPSVFWDCLSLVPEQVSPLQWWRGENSYLLFSFLRIYDPLILGVKRHLFNMQSSFCEQSVGCTFRVTCLEMIEEIIMNWDTGKSFCLYMI